MFPGGANSGVFSRPRRADVRLHHVHPDRQRRLRTRLAGAQRLLLVVTHPDADGDVGIEPDEPRVGVVVHRARLAGDRPVQRRCGRRRAPLRRPRAAGSSSRTPCRPESPREAPAGSLRAGCRPGRARAARRTGACARPGSGTPRRRSSPRAAWLRPPRARSTDTAGTGSRSRSASRTESRRRARAARAAARSARCATARARSAA